MRLVLGAAAGIIFFLASLAVFWVNEGRSDLSKIAAKAKPVEAEAPGGVEEGVLATVTGELVSSDTIEDPLFGVSGAYIRLIRAVEVFAWEEKTTSGGGSGGERAATGPTYRKVWTTEPEDSSEFKEPAGHANPALVVKEATFTVRTATIGSFAVDPARLELPAANKVELDGDLSLGPDETLVGGDTIFKGQGTFEKPAIGDLRIGYRAVEKGKRVTVFGKLSGERIVPFFHRGKHRLYRATSGEREEGIAEMAAEHKAVTWGLRAAGFFLMWLGLWLALGPVNAVFNLVPILGGAGRFLVGVLTLLTAAILSTAAVLISIIGHNLIAVILVVVVGLALVLIRRRG